MHLREVEHVCDYAGREFLDLVVVVAEHCVVVLFGIVDVLRITGLLVLAELYLSELDAVLIVGQLIVGDQEKDRNQYQQNKY